MQSEDTFWPEIAGELGKLGWHSGTNLQVEGRYANNTRGKLESMAQELVRAKVEVIVANGPGPTKWAQRATTSIPIVFFAADAVSYGLVRSLANPGGNATGYSLNSSASISKLISLLRDVRPGLRRVCVLATDGYNGLIKSGFEESCRSIAAESIAVPVVPSAGVDAAIAYMTRKGGEALLLISDSFTLAHHAELVSAATRAGIVTVGDAAEYASSDGALAGYSANSDEAKARLVYFIDRILRGARPADLPVEEPVRYDLTINLKTARALGVVVPRSLLLQATTLIQ